jgi:hypothetical protein
LRGRLTPPWKKIPPTRKKVWETLKVIRILMNGYLIVMCAEEIEFFENKHDWLRLSTRSAVQTFQQKLQMFGK